MNRLLTDADVVLPVGCMQREHSAGYYGIHTTIYPEYSDKHTQARFRKHDRFTGNGHHRELQHEVNHVAWLLGVNFSLQVVPAAGDGILHVLAGQSDVVRRQCRELYRAAWNRSVAHRANLVVAAIEGGPRQQTWENLGRVLESAARLVEEDGAIAVCCDLATAPGPALQRLIGAPCAKRPCGRSAAIIPAMPCPPCNLPALWKPTAFTCSAVSTPDWWKNWIWFLSMGRMNWCG